MQSVSQSSIETPPHPSTPLPEAHALPADAVLAHFEVSPTHGLNPVEARQRRRRVGPNRLGEPRSRRSIDILADQFKSPIVAVLGAAAVAALLFGHWTEAGAIGTVIVINAAIGFFTELRAFRSMEALRRLSVVTARVLRRGRTRVIPAKNLVPGDIVLVEGGDILSADLRLVEASNLQCDESVLTGESLPVSKHIEPLAYDTELADRSNMAFQGTAVTRGTAVGVVTSTGIATELGKIAILAEEAEAAETPLERRIADLSRQLVWVTLGLAVAIGATGIATGKPPLLMLETAIALAVAAVPEGLPMVATLALARGMWRMARRNALVERLSAVETLGATTVILTDKTGTLTENRMAVVRLLPPSGEVSLEGVAPDLTHNVQLRALLETCVLCNNAVIAGMDGEVDESRAVGDPMEVALLIAGARAGLHREKLLERYPELQEESFDPELKMMATVHRTDGQYLVAVKGAPESLLRCVAHVGKGLGTAPLGDTERLRWQESADELASQGLRVLAVASKRATDPNAPVYQDLTLLGLVGLQDPPRADVADAIAACKKAGIQVVMVTGDHAETAQQIADTVGLAGAGDRPVVEGKALTAAMIRGAHFWALRSLRASHLNRSSTSLHCIKIRVPSSR